jgi:N-acyl-D-aspartate/D-glutamate deacylase
MDGESFEDYLQDLGAVKPAIDVLPLLGRTTVRIAAMGLSANSPRGFEMEEMKTLVTQEFADQIGADGYASDAGSATKLAKALMHE